MAWLLTCTPKLAAVWRNCEELASGFCIHVNTVVWLKIAPSSCAVERSTKPLARSKAVARLVKIVCIVSLTCDILLMKNLLGSDGPSEYALVYHFHEAFCSLASLRLMPIRAD